MKIHVKFHEKCDRKLKSITFFMKFTLISNQYTWELTKRLNHF